jgi:hypothetical protein
MSDLRRPVSSAGERTTALKCSRRTALSWRRALRSFAASLS